MNVRAREVVDLQFSKWMDKTYEEANTEDEYYPSGQEDYTDLS